MDRADIDLDLFAFNVRAARVNEGLSQTELARRSGVTLASVYRVEKGVKTHRRTLEKIAAGLAVVFEDLLLEKRSQSQTSAYLVHRANEATWLATSDQRKSRPPDSLQAIQALSERQRLGKLGFVPLFMCPPLIVPQNGPGVVLLESFDVVSGPFNADFYEDGALFVMRGKVAGTIRDESFELNEGDWIAFKNADLNSFGVSPGVESATLLWIGATRVKRNNKPPRGSSQTS